MTTHELYINDILMDIDKDVNIYPKFQSPIFTDLEYIISHITNNISLPITASNARAIEMYHLVDNQDPIFSTKSFPRRWHTVRYYRNGMEICRSALGKIINIEDDRINFAFTWGNIENFKQLFDKTLNQLSFDGMASWNPYLVYVESQETQYGFFDIDFGAGYIKQYQHPCVTSNYIISQIAKDNGLIINIVKKGELLTDNYLIPCLTKKSNDRSNFSSRYWSTKNIITQITHSDNQIITIDLSITPEVYENADPADGKYNLDYFHDPASLWDETENKFDVTDIDKIRFQMSAFSLVSTFVYEAIPFPELEIELCSGIKIRPTITEYPGVKQTYDFGAIDMEINVSSVKNFDIKLGQLRGAVAGAGGNVIILRQNISLDSACPSITIVPVLKELRHGLKWNSEVHFPLSINLPEMKQSDFLHAVMQMNGLFAYAKDEKTIDFLSIDDIVDNIPKALDWTEKLVNTSLSYHAPESIGFEFLNFEQKNRFTYDNDSEISKDYGASILIDNETIKEGKDKKIIQLPFSPSNFTMYRYNIFEDLVKGKKNAAIIPLYTKDESTDDTIRYDYNDGLKPRILKSKRYSSFLIGSFEGLDWKSIFSKKYSAYQKIIKNPRVLKVGCRLSDIDLSKLDFSRPVWFSQFGNYYAIITIQTAANGICKCEFLEIKTDF